MAISTDNYTIGGVSLYFEASVAHASLLATSFSTASGMGGAFRTSGRDLGNIVSAELTPDITYIDHFIADKGKRKKDKVQANTESLTIPFTFDELNVANLKKFFMASSLSTTKLAVLEEPLVEGAAQLFFDTDVGNDFTYFIPKCTIRSDGGLSMNAEDWWTGPLVLEVLFYDTSHWASKPFGFVLASNITRA
jgi:hypothetical protein